MMKKMIYTVALATTIALATTVLFSCKKPKPTIDTTPQWSTSVTKSDMMTYLNSKAPAFNSYTLDAAIGGTITNDSVNVTFPAAAFANADGSLYTGTVKLKMQTIRTIKDMIYSGVTTTASNDELIISDGMFKLEAYDGSNNPLKLKEGMEYSAEFPRFNTSNIIFEGNAVSGNNRIEWDVWDSVDVTRGHGTTFVTGLDSLFKFCNLDRYMNETPLTDITVSTPAGYTNINTECVMKYTGENASAYIPSNATLKKFTTQGGYYKVVVGRAVKIICLAKKDGKFYYDVQTIGSIVANQSVSITTMTETTEANLQTIIAAF